MLRVLRTSDGIEFEQLSAGPFIYVDQWLWAELASNASLRSKVIAIFRAVRPTIMYSTITFYEMLRITDSRQLDNISEVMDSCDFMLIVANPLSALKRQNDFPHEPVGPVNIHSVADNALVRGLFLDLEEADYSSVTGATVLKVARLPENVAHIRNLRTAIADLLNPIIEKAKDTPAIKKSINMRKRALNSTTNEYPCTSVVYQRAIDFIVVNKRMKMPESEWLAWIPTLVFRLNTTHLSELKAEAFSAKPRDRNLHFV